MTPEQIQAEIDAAIQAEIDAAEKGQKDELAAATAKTMGGPATMRPTQQIPGGLEDPSNFGQTIRAWGHEIPGAEPLAAGGDYVQNLVTGTPQTWEGTLEARRRAGAEAAQAEPGAALGGALTAAAVVPWSKGKGVIGVLKRAAQAAGLTGTTRLSQGEDIGGAAGEGLQSAGLSLGIESLVNMVPLARETVGPGLRKWSADRGWRSVNAKPQDEINLAHAFDPERVDAAPGVGEFLRDVKTADGDFVLQGDQKDVYRALKQLINETGSEKGAFVDLADSRGAKVATDEVAAALDDLLRGIDTPANRVVYPAIGPEIDAFRQRFLAEYGDKPAELVLDAAGNPTITRSVLGATVPGTKAAYSEGSRVSPLVDAQGVPVGGANTLPVKVESEQLAALRAANAAKKEASEALARFRTSNDPADLRAAYAAKDSHDAAKAQSTVVSSANDQGIIRDPQLRRSPTDELGHNRPAAEGGWSPLVRPPSNMSVNQWEDLKSTMQAFVNQTRAGMSRSDRGIAQDPALALLNRFSGVVRQADEKAAAEVLSPEELAAFLRIKKKHGMASELEPILEKAKAAENTASTPGSAVYEGRRFGHALPAVIGGVGGLGGGGFYGGGVGGLAGTVAGGVAGYGLSRGVQAFENANPTMSRVYDAAGRALMSLPETPVGMGARRAPVLHSMWDNEGMDLETLLRSLRNQPQPAQETAR